MDGKIDLEDSMPLSQWVMNQNNAEIEIHELVDKEIANMSENVTENLNDNERGEQGETSLMIEDVGSTIKEKSEAGQPRLMNVMKMMQQMVNEIKVSVRRSVNEVINSVN